jgi:hypothetical protein
VGWYEWTAVIHGDFLDDQSLQYARPA